MKKWFPAITFVVAILLAASSCAPVLDEAGAPTPGPTATATNVTATLDDLTADQKSQLTRIALKRLGLNEKRAGEYQITRFAWMNATQSDAAPRSAPADSPTGTTSPNGESRLYPGVVLHVGSPTNKEYVVMVNLDTQTVVSVTEQNLPSRDVPSSTPPQGSPGGGNMVTNDGSQMVALQFIRNDPTFRFDGMDETLKIKAAALTQGPVSPPSEFVYEFESRYAGYGDRTGMIVAQVITPHTVRIMEKDGKVVSAVMDDMWDMISQEFIGN